MESCMRAGWLFGRSRLPGFAGPAANAPPMRRLLTLLLLLIAPAAWGQTAESCFTAGNAAMARKEYQEALVQYQLGLAIEPEAHGLLYNGGTAAYLAGDGPLAARLWSKLKPLEPK